MLDTLTDDHVTVAAPEPQVRTGAEYDLSATNKHFLYLRKVHMQQLIKAAALGVSFTLAPLVVQAQTSTIDEDGTYSIFIDQSLWDQYSRPNTRKFGTLYERYTDRTGTVREYTYSVSPNSTKSFTSKAAGRYSYYKVETCYEYMNDPNSVRCRNKTTSWNFDVPVTQSLAVRRHTTAPQLSDIRADEILLDASNVLRDVDGSGDVQCAVNLRRNGAVGTFTAGDGSIDSEQEYAALANGVNVVWRINYCGGTINTGIIGCADVNGDRIAVEDWTDSLDGILWAHEFGHNQGIVHRTDSTNAVMYPSIGSSRLFVNSAECDAFWR